MPDPAPPAPSPGPFPKRLKARIAVGGAVWALVPWLIIANVGPWPFVLVLAYPVATLVVPFFVALSHPLGNEGGARVGKWVILAGIVVGAAFIPLMSLYKSIAAGAPELYLGNPFYALLIDVILSPLFILMARFAGAVGGYQPEEAQAASLDAGAPPAES